MSGKRMTPGSAGRWLLGRLGVAVALLVAAALGWWLRAGLAPARPDAVPATAAGGEADAHAAHEAAAQVWTCSMHPQIRLPEPGDCPICGMELIPLETGDGEGGLRRLTVRPEARALMGIRTSPVERRFVEAEVRMVGKLVHDETRVAYITAWAPGRLDRLYVDYTGVTVQEGDHLVSLYSPKLYADQTALLQAAAAVDRIEQGASDLQAQTAYGSRDAVRERLRQQGLTAGQIEEIEERGVASDHVTIYAPMGGVVVEKHAQQGMYVQEGSRIYTIADLSHLWVKLDAYESDLAWLHYGQSVQFTTQAYPGEVFRGTIAFIAPELDGRTRTTKVRVNLDNADGRLKPDMFVTAVVRTRVAAGGRAMDPNLAGMWICPMHPEIVSPEPGLCTVCEMSLVTAESLGYVAARDEPADMPLVIPVSAALITGTRAVVYVELEDVDQPTFEGREVVLGPRAGDWYLVRGGLEEGESVVTQGSFKIDSALQIQARPSMMTPEGGGATGAHQHHGSGPEPAGTDEPQDGRIQLDPRARSGLDPIEAAWERLRSWPDDESLQEVQSAFRSVGEAVDAVDASLFHGRAVALWKELAMQLGNDALEGGAARDFEDARRIRELLRRNMERLRATFGTQPTAGRAAVALRGPLREALRSFWGAYQETRAALVEDDLAAARTAALSAREALLAADAAAAGAPGGEAWSEAAPQLALAVDALVDAGGLEPFRSGFAALSGQVGELVRTLDFEPGGVVELWCPMALGEGAAWLQADEEVGNPYLGRSMPSCGEVVRTLRAAPAQDGGQEGAAHGGHATGDGDE